MQLRTGLVVTAFCTITSLTGSAAAEPVGWLGEDCADSRQRFESRLDSLTGPAVREQLSGSVSTRKKGRKLSIRLELVLARRPLPAREIDVRSCAEAADTAAVVVAMAAAESKLSEPARPAAATPAPNPATPATSIAPAAAPVVSKPSPAPPPSPPPRASDVELRAGVSGLLEWGVLPSPAWGLSAQVLLGLNRRWWLGALASSSLSQEHATTDSKLARFRFMSAIVRGCLTMFARGPVRGQACAGLEGLWSRGTGKDFDVNRSATLLQAAPHAAWVLSLEAPRSIEWHGEIAASVPLTRPSFLAEQRELARAWPVVLAARLGPMVRF